MILTVILASVIFVLIVAYLKGRYNQYYWTKRGVVFSERNKTGGPMWQFATTAKPFFQILHEIYKEHENSHAVGIGSLVDPALYVKNPVDIQHITQGDFQAFNHRGVQINEEDILANNVLFLHGPKWKVLRQKLTPLFTTAKLRNMYYIVDKSAQDFVEFLEQNPEKLKKDTYNTLTHFCSAAISAAVFGIGTKSTFDSPFHAMAKKVLNPGSAINLKFAINGISDSLARFLKFKLFAEQEEFFIGAIREVIKQREKENVNRHDYIDMCIALQRSGTMVDKDTGEKVEPTVEVLAAQAFFFFLAGVDPSAAGIFAILLELGKHPEILKQLHDEIDATFEKHNGQLNYDAVSDMKCLNNVFNESLRLHPPIGYLTRQCIKDSVLPEAQVTVEAGVKIYTPIFELHHDPKYFSNPEVFDPDRFAREGEVSDNTYMPFGQGNRFCIGARFARIQIMTGVVHLLRNYTLVTHLQPGGLAYVKETVQVRLKNVDVELIPRK